VHAIDAGPRAVELLQVHDELALADRLRRQVQHAAREPRGEIALGGDQAAAAAAARREIQRRTKAEQPCHRRHLRRH
jgi:hypothetical protein